MVTLRKHLLVKNVLSKTPIYISLKDNIVVPEKMKMVWFEDNHT
jgi:CRISPR-associated endonuclease Csn1